MDRNLNDKQLKKLADGREYRSMAVELRTLKDNDMTVEGYATTFNKPYLLYEEPGFKVYEQIDARAFDECDMRDVIMQYDHKDRVYARTRNNTLMLTVDEMGLLIRAYLGGTDIGKQLYQEIKGGYTDKMSFGFIVAESKRESVMNSDTGEVVVTRTITKIKKLFDVSAVSIPANDMTSISARDYFNGVIEEIKAERLLRANKIKKIKLLMEV